MSGNAYRHLPVEGLPHGICVVDADHRVALWSPKLEQWLGISREDAEGTAVGELPAPIDRNAWLHWCDSILGGTDSTLRSLFARDQLLNTAPECCPSQLIASAHRYQLDDAAAVLILIEDRIADADLQAMQSEIECESERLKAEFLALVSHELRTPLNGILGMTVLLQSTSLSQQQSEYLTTLHVSGEAMLSVVTELLDFANVMRKGLASENAHFQPVSLVESTAATWAPWAFDKGLDFIVDCDESVPEWVVGSPDKLRHALSSIVNNAVKFTDRGAVIVRAHATLAGESSELQIDIEDTGIGIDLKQQGHVAAAFAQAESTMTRRHSGLGLGLSTSHELVARIGGKLLLDSVPGEGTTISIRVPIAADITAPDQTVSAELPPHLCVSVEGNTVAASNLRERLQRSEVTVVAAESETAGAGEEQAPTIAIREVPPAKGDGVSVFEVTAIAAGAAAPTQVLEQPIRRDTLHHALIHTSAAPEEPQPTTSDHRVRALLVEDSPVNQRMMTHLLQRVGCAVSVAANGAEAVEMAAQGDYDVIFMDCQMPVLDGFEATRQIRATESAGRRVPIVALTVHGLPEDIEECLACGMDSHIPKPAGEESLTAALQGIQSLA